MLFRSDERAVGGEEVDQVVPAAVVEGLAVVGAELPDGVQVLQAAHACGQVLRRVLLDVGGGALVVSQFTLIADTAKGNRPSFSRAAQPEAAEPLYEAFCAALAAEGVHVARGIFGARMQVELVNDGPVTIILET